LKHVEELARKKFAEVSDDVWKNTCRNVDAEKIFIEKGHIFGTVIDNLSFTVNTGLSDELEDEEISNDEFNISGIVPFDSDSE
jgi:hypothetical protein